MRKYESTILTLLAIAVVVFLGGCAGGVRYIITEPTPQTVPVTGLEIKDKIIEIFDSHNGSCSEGNNLWVAIKRTSKSYLAGKIDFETGQVSELSEIDEYDFYNPLYWGNLKEETMGGGEMCIGACLSVTPFGGTTAKYGFDAEKEFWCDNSNKLSITYQYSEKTSTYGGGYGGYSYTETEWQRGATQKFVKGRDVIEIETASGYSHAFMSTGNVKKCRYYPLTEKTFIGFQPEKLNNITVVDLFFYDLDSKNSWGADLDFSRENPYIDAGVTKDGAIVGIIAGKPGNYTLRKYTPDDLVYAIKMHKTVQ